MFKQLEKVFSALGDTQRLKILVLVSKRPGINEKELVEQLNISQGTISYHLNKLYLRDLLLKEKNKTSFEIEINSDKLKSIGFEYSTFQETLERQMQ